MAQTYYEVLGVAENATNAEIEAAFKGKAREVHPDKVPPGNPYLRKVTSEAFKDLSEAKSVLLDSVERQKYDAELAYMRGSEQSYAAPATPPPPPSPPPAPASTPQQVQKHSFWKPAKTRFGTGVLAAGALGCILFLVGVTAGDKTALLGLTLICLTLALLCWRHGSRPGTDAAFLGGSVFLFIFAAISFAGWLQPAQSGPSAPATTEIPQRPVGKLTPFQAAGPPKAPVGKLHALGGTPKANQLQRPGSRDPILAAINASKGDNTDSSASVSATISTLPKQPTELATKTWKNVRDGQSYRTHSKGGVLYLESVDDYLKRVGDIVSCQFNPAVSPGLNWTGFCWERNPKDQSIYRSSAALTVFSDARIEGSTSYIPNFTMIPIESSASESAQRPLGIERPIQTPSRSDTGPFPEKAGTSPLATRPAQPYASDLSGPERQSIESACSRDKYINGPAAYNRCLENQLSLLGTAPRRPDLSSLSDPEQQSIESACSRDKYINGPAAYNRCLESQLSRLGTASRRPDLSSLSDPEQQSIESACSRDKYINGPAAYNQCLESQLSRLGTAPRRPDLSSLSDPERQSIESACSRDKYINGPAAYNRCLSKLLGLLKTSR